MRQATSVVNIVASSFVSQDPAFSTVAPWSENGPWLLDALLDLRLVQRRWEMAISTRPRPLIEMTLDFIGNTNSKEEASLSLRDKAYTLLILICGDMIINPGDLILAETSGETGRLLFCKALLTIVQAAVQSRVIGRLAETKLVNELALLSAQYSAVGENTDVWVGPYDTHKTSSRR